jgi:branched-chain amino acid transport system permease protein
MMIASFALGFVIKYFLLMLYSSRPKSIDLWSNLSLPVEIFGARIPLLQVITICVTIVILIGLTAFLKRTRYGLEMRAAAENFTMARMLGVRANNVIMLAFCAEWRAGRRHRPDPRDADRHGGHTDGRLRDAGGLHCDRDRRPWQHGGAVIAGFLIGGATVLMQVVLPVDARPFRDAFVYAAVIVILIWRPNGLFAAKSAKQRV